jgi:hypothetical protein
MMHINKAFKRLTRKEFQGFFDQSYPGTSLAQICPFVRKPNNNVRPASGYLVAVGITVMDSGRS